MQRQQGSRHVTAERVFRVQLGRPYTEHPIAPARPTFIAKLAQRCFDVDHAACLDLVVGNSVNGADREIRARDLDDFHWIELAGTSVYRGRGGFLDD